MLKKTGTIIMSKHSMEITVTFLMVTLLSPYFEKLAATPEVQSHNINKYCTF